MAAKLGSFTVYRIRDSIGGRLVTEFEDAIACPEEMIAYDLPDDFEYSARLFIPPLREKKPGWVDFLQALFGDLAEIKESVANSAILIMDIPYYSRHVFFAFTFGGGRHFLKANGYERNYGLRVALNAIYERQHASGELNPIRVRSVDLKTVAANTLRTRRQADRRSLFETFGVDVDRDLLKGITGQPANTNTWGTRITGADSLHIYRVVEFDKLGELCKRIERTHRRSDYKDWFEWVDNVHAITDIDLLAELMECVLKQFRNRDVDRLELAPPELVAWDDIKAFRFSVEPDSDYPDLALTNYLDILGDELAALTAKQLCAKHKIEALGEDADLIHRWSVFRCITGEFKLRGKTYLMSGGDFFLVAKKYLDDLNGYINNIPESAKSLPDSEGDKDEGEYNEIAAGSSGDYLLLDKQTVRISRYTSPIEICDILTQDGCFIHVKRKLGSSSLSHLFSQGYVSADLFLMSEAYRVAVQEKVAEAEMEKGIQNRKFLTYDSDAISPRDYEIVYAIVAKWKEREFGEALPFFSKVNLRRHVEDLRRMGYRVSCKRIHVT